MAVGVSAASTLKTTTNGTDQVHNDPGGNNGDLIVAICLHSSSTKPTVTGFTEQLSVGNSFPLYTILTRVRDGTEGASFTVNGAASSLCSSCILNLTGANTSRPVGAWQAQQPPASSNNPPAPGIYVPAGAFVGIWGWLNAVAWTSAAVLSHDTGTMTWTEVGEYTAAGSSSGVFDYGLANAAITLSNSTFSITGGSAQSTGGFTFIISPADIEDVIVTTTGTGNITAPATASSVRLQAVGAGGGGGQETGAECGGGGGAFAETTSVSVTGGSSIVYYSVGAGGGPAANGGDSWARVGTNSAPSSTTDGCLANGGSGVATGGGAGGTAGNSIGNITAQGGTGGIDQGGGGSRAGSGGGSAGDRTGFNNNGSAGSGSSVGLGGLGGPGAGSGGNGGPAGSSGVTGFVPGGGGGGGGNSGGNAGSGGSGLVRLIFTLTGPSIGRADETDTAYNQDMALAHGQSNETDTASKPGGPTVLIGIGKPYPQRVGLVEVAGIADGSGNATIDISSLGLRPSDLVIVNTVVQSNSALTITVSGDVNGSYTDLGTAYVNGVNDINQATHHNPNTGVADASSLTLGGLGASNRFVVQVQQYIGVATTPIETLSNAGSASSSNADPPSRTPTLPGAKIVANYAAAMDNAQTWTTPPANISNFSQLDDNDSVGHGARAGCGDADWVSGAFDPNSAVNSGSTTNDTSLGMTLVLRAANGAQERDTAIIRGLAQKVQFQTETDTAFALSQGVVQLPVGQANETDTAFKAGGIAMAPNVSVEADAAFTQNVVLQVQRANEADTAFARPQLGGVGLAVEADSAFALGKAFIKKVGFVSVANGNFDSNYLSDWATFDSTISVVAGRLRVVADQAVSIKATATFPSTGAALRVGNIVQVSGTSISGTAPGTVRLDNGAVNAPGQPYLNTSFNVETVLVADSVKIDASLNDMGAVSVGQYAEFDNFVITEIPLEVDTAFALNRVDTPAWSFASETDSAFALTVSYVHGFSTETDTALALGGIFDLLPGRADEADSAFALTAVNVRPVGFTSETNTARQPGVGWATGRANSTETAFARNALVTYAIGMAIETDTAFQMFGALEAGSGRKPHIRLDSILRDRVQPVHKTV